MSMDDFNFDDWCSEHGIIDKTSDKLKNEDITDVDSLFSLSYSDIMELGLTIGQRNKLKKAMGHLGIGKKDAKVDGAHGNPVTTKDLSKNTEINSLLESLNDSSFKDLLKMGDNDGVCDMDNLHSAKSAGKRFMKRLTTL